VVEDCAQAQGAYVGEDPVGSLGAVGCFSFYPTKNLGAIGDGGAVVGSEELVEKVRQLRTYGWTEPQYAEIENGRCSRLDELQAAYLNIRLGVLADAVSARQRVAKRYLEELADLPFDLPRVRQGNTHAYHLFVIKTDRRDELRQHLAAAEIGTGLHYPFPAHKQPGLAANSRTSVALATTEMLQSKILSLPLFASITDDEVSAVVEAVRGFFGR